MSRGQLVRRKKGGMTRPRNLRTAFSKSSGFLAMLSEVTPAFKYFFCLHANETLSRLEQTPKLVVAAINGHCVGGRCRFETALSPDALSGG